MWGLRIAHLKKHTKYKGIQTATSGMEIYCWKFWAVDPKYLCQLTPIYRSKDFTPAQWYRRAEFAARPISNTSSKRQAGMANRREASYVLFSPQGKKPQKGQGNCCDMGCNSGRLTMLLEVLLHVPYMLQLLRIASSKIHKVFDMSLQFNLPACQIQEKKPCIQLKQVNVVSI